jgi:hypothetical protein
MLNAEYRQRPQHFWHKKRLYSSHTVRNRLLKDQLTGKREYKTAEYDGWQRDGRTEQVCVVATLYTRTAWLSAVLTEIFHDFP